MNPTSDWSGRLLTEALTEQPSLILSFYSFGVMLHKRDGEQVTEYPVDPAQVALALAAKVRFDTGLLSEHPAGPAGRGEEDRRRVPPAAEDRAVSGRLGNARCACRCPADLHPRHDRGQEPAVSGLCGQEAPCHARCAAVSCAAAERVQHRHDLLGQRAAGLRRRRCEARRWRKTGVSCSVRASAIMASAARAKRTCATSASSSLPWKNAKRASIRNPI